MLSCRVEEDVAQLRLVTPLPSTHTRRTPNRNHTRRNFFFVLGQTHLARVPGFLPATSGTTTNRVSHFTPALGDSFLPPVGLQHAQPHPPLCVQTLPRQPANKHAHFEKYIIRRHRRRRCEERHSSTGISPTTLTVFARGLKRRLHNSQFEELGYHCEYKLCSSKFCGCQLRQRRQTWVGREARVATTD